MRTGRDAFIVLLCFGLNVIKINKTFQGRALYLSRIIPAALECHCTIRINTGEINDDVC